MLCVSVKTNLPSSGPITRLQNNTLLCNITLAFILPKHKYSVDWLEKLIFTIMYVCMYVCVGVRVCMYVELTVSFTVTISNIL